MGLLDDAIREHLDLKRRRGADPAEIDRAEREALGPVRRGPEDLDQVSETGEPQQGPVGAEEPRNDAEEHPDAWEEPHGEPPGMFDEEPEPAFGHDPAPTEADDEFAPPPPH